MNLYTLQLKNRITVKAESFYSLKRLQNGRGDPLGHRVNQIKWKIFKAVMQKGTSG